MVEYLKLLQNILDNGVEKESGRANMPNTIGISNSVIKMNLQNGFPLLTTKKMYWKGIVHELLWFLRGETNIAYLVENNVNIWNKDALRWYKTEYVQKRGAPDMEMDEFLENVNNGNEFFFNSQEIDCEHCIDHYTYGDLGKVYGYQWRDQNGVDQIMEIVDGLKNNPYSRYHILDGWNKADFKEMALPPCHLLYHFIVRPLSVFERENIYAKKHGFSDEERMEMNPNATDNDVHQLMDEDNIPRFYLDLNMYQRSVDTPLGAPYNLASMSLLLMLFAKLNNMIDGVATWIGGDTHIYINQIEGIKEQLKRDPYDLPQMKINKELNTLDDILNLTIDDFELIGYKSHPKIKFELSVGLKK